MNSIAETFYIKRYSDRTSDKRRKASMEKSRAKAIK